MVLVNPASVGIECHLRGEFSGTLGALTDRVHLNAPAVRLFSGLCHFDVSKRAPFNSAERRQTNLVSFPNPVS